jgi:hypothetical protein
LQPPPSSHDEYSLDTQPLSSKASSGKNAAMDPMPGAEAMLEGE